MSLRTTDICFSCDLGECHKCNGKTIRGHICQHGCAVKEFGNTSYTVVYHKFWDFLDMIPDSNSLRKLATDYYDLFVKSPGSSYNHQAWDGGYLHHIVETMNVAVQLYAVLSGLRPLPFTVADALTVMTLHDIEKPFKDNPNALTPLGISWNQYREEAKTKWHQSHHSSDLINWKAVRRQFRTDLIIRAGIVIPNELWNALEYVEGEREDYTPSKRVMNELGAFCHCCDIISARIWHDKGNGESW